MSSENDPRAVANLMLDEAGRLGISLTNLALQKLLYFSHGLHLVRTKRPLVKGYFEAWQFGPVHPATYQAFKSAGSSPISFRAVARDPLSGLERDIKTPDDPELLSLLLYVVNSYGRMTPGRLVDISHAKDSPWAYVVEKARTEVAFGLRISDNLILDRFRYHKVSVGDEPRLGEPADDSPFA